MGRLREIMVELKFHLNKRVDKKVAWMFCDLKRGGIDFGQRITNVLPNLNLKDRKKTKEDIGKEIDLFYQKNLSHIKKSKLRFEKLWLEIEKDAIAFYNYFFDLKPDFKVKAYLSIFNIHPKDIIDREFQIWYRSKHPKLTCLHEIGHFYFYEKLRQQKRLRDYRQLENDNTIWQISEIFNNFLLDQPEVKKLHNRISRGYPEHHKITMAIAKEKTRYRDYDELVEAIKDKIKK